VANLFADENFPLPVVERLRSLGHAVVTLQEAGKANLALPDAEVLAMASERGALLTLNRRHFIKLHNAGGAHAGIIVCTYDPDFDGLAQRIDVMVRDKGDLRDRLVRINRKG
jgi:hypothetical protein